jgi:hypothetical protein
MIRSGSVIHGFVEYASRSLQCFILSGNDNAVADAETLGSALDANYTQALPAFSTNAPGTGSLNLTARTHTTSPQPAWHGIELWAS